MCGPGSFAAFEAAEGRYVVATFPSAAREIVALYAAWPLVQVDLPLILTASQLEERHKVSFWDALVVEAARRARATRIVTEDLQGGRQIGGVRIENPFLRSAYQYAKPK